MSMKKSRLHIAGCDAVLKLTIWENIASDKMLAQWLPLNGAVADVGQYTIEAGLYAYICRSWYCISTHTTE